MKKRAVFLFLAGLMVFVCLCNPIQKALGFGDFDSGSDYGGSDSGGYSSSDHDSSSSDRNRSSKDSGKSELSPVTEFFGYIFMIGLIGFFIHVFISTRKGSESRSSSSTIQRDPWEKGLISEEGIEQLRKEDPEFSETALYDYVRKLFTEMQKDWESGDITSVQYGFLPDAWERFNTQLQMKNQRMEVTHVRDIRFDKLQLTAFHYLSHAKKYTLTITFQVCYNVWVKRNGMNIQGSPSTRHQMLYRWHMERPQEAKLITDPNHCPNCGAELDVSAFAECPFCHTKITQQTGQWRIQDIQCLRQVTLHP